MAAVVVPALILLASDGDVGWGLAGAAAALPVLLGIVLIAAGFALWLWTARLLARVGKGTLAPWDPTTRLVVVGPYGRMRNPMITAVLAVLAGEAALFGSVAVLVGARSSSSSTTFSSSSTRSGRWNAGSGMSTAPTCARCRAGCRASAPDPAEEGADERLGVGEGHHVAGALDQRVARVGHVAPDDLAYRVADG